MNTLRVLGGLWVESDGATIGRGNQRQRLALLAVIWLSPSRRVTRDKVLSLLWPESTATEGRHRLSTAIYDIRRTLGSDVVRSVGDELWIPADATLACDVGEFERAVHENAWDAAFSAYHGPLLDGVHVHGSYEFDEWIATHRDRLLRQYATVLERLIDARQLGGHAQGAVDAARLLCGIEPHSERIALRAADVIAGSGDRSEAIRLLERFAARVSTELSVPAPSTVAQRIRELRAALAHDTNGATVLQRATLSTRGPETVSDDTQIPTRSVVSRAPHETTSSVAGVERVPHEKARRSSIARSSIAKSVMLIAATLVLVIMGAMYVRRATASGDSFGVSVQLINDTDARVSDVSARSMQKKLAQSLTEIGACGKSGALTNTPGARGGCSVSAQLIVRDTIVVALATLRASASGASLASAETPLQVQEFDEGMVMLARELVASALTSTGNDLAAAAMRSTRVTTAAQAFLTGDAQFRHGFYAAARASLEGAVVADSTFALAHYRLSQTMLWQDVPSTLAMAHDSAMMRFIDGVPQTEQLLLRAYSAWRVGDAVRADSLCKALLARNPRHADAWFQLGETHFHYNALRGRSPNEAGDAFDWALAMDSTYWGARWHLLLLGAAHDTAAATRARIDALLAGHDDGFIAREMRLFAADTGTALAALSKDADASVLFDAAWRRAIFRGDLAGAESLLLTMNQGNRSPSRQNKGRYLVGALRFGTGRVSDALRMLPTSSPSRDAGEGLVILVTATLGNALHQGVADPDSLQQILAEWQHSATALPKSTIDQVTATYLLGLLAGAQSDHARAEYNAVGLETMHDSAHASHELAEAVRAYDEYRHNNCSAAVARLDRAAPHIWLGVIASTALANDGLMRLLRADCLERQGRYAEAIAWYNTIEHNTLFDLALLQPALRGQMRAYRALGDARSVRQLTMRLASR